MTITKYLWIWSAYASSLLVFRIDISMELGVAGGVLHICAIWLAQASHSRRAIVPVASLCVLLNLLAVFFSPAGSPVWKVALNRSIGVVVIWGTAIRSRRLLTALEENATQLKVTESSRNELSLRHDDDLRKRRALISVMDDLKHEIKQRASVEERLRHREEELHSALGNANELVDELRRINTELDSFTYIASHDLQEPLRNIIAYSDLLKEDLRCELPPKAAEDLKFIGDASYRMRRLIKDLLSYSRAGRGVPNRQAVELDDCLEEALQSLQSRIDDTQATIDREPLPELSVDRTMIRQVFQNLIGNAIKFSGPEPPRIRISASRDDHAWNIQVRDNGIGLKKEYAQQIFAPFQRLHGISEYEGSGIGLAICQKIVEAHGGEISAISHPNRGAVFQFSLPDPEGTS